MYLVWAQHLTLIMIRKKGLKRITIDTTGQEKAVYIDYRIVSYPEITL